MHRALRLDALVAPLREDVVSGASELARKAAEVLGRGVEADSSATDIRSLVWAVGRRILDAQPAMAPLVGLVAAALRAAGEVAEPAGARRVVGEAVVGFASEIRRRAPELAARAAGVLPKEGDVLTLSSSVLHTLLHARDGTGEPGPPAEGETWPAAWPRRTCPYPSPWTPRSPRWSRRARPSSSAPIPSATGAW